MVADSRLPNFRALTPAQRLEHIAGIASLTADETALLSRPGALGMDRANGMIENVIGTFELPLGVAGNFVVNGREYLVPMVVEEPSVVAAASFMAKLAREGGGFEASSTGPLMRAQVQVVGIGDEDKMDVTRSGAVVHEATHMYAGTKDISLENEVYDHIGWARPGHNEKREVAYGPLRCLALAKVRPADAVKNADSYRIFCELAKYHRQHAGAPIVIR